MDAGRRRRRDAAPADITEAIRPGYNAQSSLEEAAASLAKLARFEPAVVSELPGESLLRIEVNGHLAGAVRCFPDAPAELAVGWAFMHGFFSSDSIDSVTVHADRVSLMVEADVDIDRHRVHVTGWGSDPHLADMPDSAGDADSPFAIHADVLLDVVREALGVMARDRARDGFVHAAVATDTGVECVARDGTTSLAVAKVIGWTLLEGRERRPRILVTHGVVDRDIIESVARCGLSVVVTTGIPTADAFRSATGCDVSVVGLVSSPHPGLFVDAGHVIEDDVSPDAR